MKSLGILISLTALLVGLFSMFSIYIATLPVVNANYIIYGAFLGLFSIPMTLNGTRVSKWTGSVGFLGCVTMGALHFVGMLISRGAS